MMSPRTSHVARLPTPREPGRARLVPWRCERCEKVLLELDPERPSYLRKKCERCGEINTWVEAYRPPP